MIRYVLIFALLIRLVAAWGWQAKADSEGNVFRFGDSESYWTMAGKIGQGLPYQYGGPDSKVFRAPAYPLFLAPFTVLESQFGVSKRTAALVARGAGCLLGVLSVWLVYAVTRQLAGERAAGFAAIFAQSIQGRLG